MNRHPSDLVWTQLVDRALPLLQRVRLNWHLRRCERCRLQCAALLAERETFAAEPIRQTELQTLVARVAHQDARRSPRWASWGFGSAMLAAVALLVVNLGSNGQDELRAKGGDAFDLVLKRGDDVFPMGPRCLPGDALRARLHSPRRNAFVVGIDVTGKVSPLFPFGGQRSALLPLEGELTPGSWVLDEAPGQERFVAVFSDAPLELDQIREALLKTAPAIAGAVLLERSCRKAVP